MEAIDSNGVYPMSHTDRVFSRAHYFRRHLQKNVVPFLEEFPEENPLAGKRLPKLDKLNTSIQKRWPAAKLDQWESGKAKLSDLPIDHAVTISEILPGGSAAATDRLASFLDSKLEHYGDRNQPERDVATGLSPYLHFGHISAHQIMDGVLKQNSWSPDLLAPKPNGSANGWWGLPEHVEGFIDELLTWRELGYNMCHLVPEYDQYESLPEWAQKTLQEHEGDKRDYLYSLEEFEQSLTHDTLWNAA